MFGYPLVPSLTKVLSPTLIESSNSLTKDPYLMQDPSCGMHGVHYPYLKLDCLFCLVIMRHLRAREGRFKVDPLPIFYAI